MADLPAIFAEAGIVVPPGYDGACFRCGKPRNMRGDEAGLCVDCHDECTWTKDGYEDTVRSELKNGRWFIQTRQNHWKNSLLPDVPRAVIEGMGVDAPSAGAHPVAVSDAIRGAVDPAPKRAEADEYHVVEQEPHEDICLAAKGGVCWVDASAEVSDDLWCWSARITREEFEAGRVSREAARKLLATERTWLVTPPGGSSRAPYVKRGTLDSSDGFIDGGRGRPW